MDIGVLAASMVKVFICLALYFGAKKKYTRKDEGFVKYEIVKAKGYFSPRPVPACLLGYKSSWKKSLLEKLGPLGEQEGPFFNGQS